VPLIHFTNTQSERQHSDPHAWLAQKEQYIAEQRPIYEAYIRALDEAVAAVVAAVQKGPKS